LSGGRPFTGGVHDIRVEHAALPPPSLAYLRLPSSLTEAIERALAKNPEQRFATCTSFVDQALRDVERSAKEEGVVRLLCPGCKSVLKLSPTTGGKRGKCPECAVPVETAEGCVALWLQSEALSLGKAETSVEFPQEGGTWDITTTLNPPSSEEIVEGSPADQATPQTLPTIPEHHRRRVPRRIVLPIATCLALILLLALIMWRNAPGDGDGHIEGQQPEGPGPIDLVGWIYDDKESEYKAHPDGTFQDITQEKTGATPTAISLRWKRIGDEKVDSGDSSTYFEVTRDGKPWLIIQLRGTSKDGVLWGVVEAHGEVRPPEDPEGR
jgi:hypothetical protein